MPLSPRVPDLAALDLLLSVIELGSLGRAAKAHGISQPSASSRIRYLEQLVGVPVLERTTLGSRPTAAGALIAEWARDVVDAATRLDAGIDTLRAQRDSRLRVAASQTVAEYLFPKWLVGLRARMPETSIALISGNSAEVAKAVLEGRAGIGFVESPLLPPGLESQVVARDRLVVVVAAGHPWARRAEIDVRELAGTALIYRESGSGTRNSFERVMRPSGCPGGNPMWHWSCRRPRRSRRRWPRGSVRRCSVRWRSPPNWPRAAWSHLRLPGWIWNGSCVPSGRSDNNRPVRRVTCMPLRAAPFEHSLGVLSELLTE